jgi:hypothetical protein
MEGEDRLMEVRDIASQLGMAESGVRRILRTGELKGRKFGDTWKAMKSNVDAYMRGEKTTPEPKTDKPAEAPKAEKPTEVNPEVAKIVAETAEVDAKISLQNKQWELAAVLSGFKTAGEYKKALADLDAVCAKNDQTVAEQQAEFQQEAERLQARSAALDERDNAIKDREIEMGHQIKATEDFKAQSEQEAEALKIAKVAEGDAYIEKAKLDAQAIIDEAKASDLTIRQEADTYFAERKAQADAIEAGIAALQAKHDAIKAEYEPDFTKITAKVQDTIKWYNEQWAVVKDDKSRGGTYVRWDIKDAISALNGLLKKITG